MLCIHCERPVDSEEACSHCGESPLVAERYRVLDVLGRGATATTYRAERVPDEEEVALKELLVRHAQSLKTLELFEREAAVLRQLHHPSIPRYLDHFDVELGPNVGMYLAQEFIEGESLQRIVERGALSVHVALEVVRSVSETLCYLQGLRPPVTHRDLKPANLLRRSDGTFALIDFGSVTDSLAETEGVPTMAGTIGYMAPEQLQGRTHPRTDVYGLAATAVHLLSGTHPSDVEDFDDWSLRLPPELRPLMKRMLANEPANRPTPEEVAEQLDDFESVLRAREDAARRRKTLLDTISEVPRKLPPNFVYTPTFMGIGTPRGRRRERLYTHGEVTVGEVTQVSSLLDVGALRVMFTFEAEGDRFGGVRDVGVGQVGDVELGDDLLIFFEPGSPEFHEPLFELVWRGS